MTELSIVRGNWPREAVEIAVQKSWLEGWRMGIAASGTVMSASWEDPRERMMPVVKTIIAYGMRGWAKVQRSKRTAARAQRRLSPHHGPVQVSGRSIFDPALRHNESPAPTWMPLTTGMGVTRFAQLSRPVTLKKPTNTATTIPAAAFSLRENLRAMATAAMAFIGWTGRGRPKERPVRMLAAPVKSSVEGNDIEFDITSAVMSGSNVPRSPSEPDSSASGCSRIVSTL